MRASTEQVIGYMSQQLLASAWHTWAHAIEFNNSLGENIYPLTAITKLVKLRGIIPKDHTDKRDRRLTHFPHIHNSLFDLRSAYLVAICFPARLTTPSQPQIAESHWEGPKKVSPPYGSFTRAFPVLRVSTLTLCPRAASRATSLLPINPVAPTMPMNKLPISHDTIYNGLCTGTVLQDFFYFLWTGKAGVHSGLLIQTERCIWLILSSRQSCIEQQAAISGSSMHPSFSGNRLSP